jgi:hypothetical protein
MFPFHKATFGAQHSHVALNMYGNVAQQHTTLPLLTRNMT